MNPKLRLASASPRRRELIKLLGLPYDCISNNSAEISFSSDPADKASEIAFEKANASLKTKPLEEGEIIIGADTIVVLENEIFGKPKDREDAERMLRLLSGKKHTVYTGVALLYLKNGYVVNETFTVGTEVYVNSLTEAEISAYLDIGEYVDKAGAYAIQGPFSRHIRKIDGDYNNVVGFPVSAIYAKITEIINDL